MTFVSSFVSLLIYRRIRLRYVAALALAHFLRRS
jgi:hypothetical protein